MKRALSRYVFISVLLIVLLSSCILDLSESIAEKKICEDYPVRIIESVSLEMKAFLDDQNITAEGFSQENQKIVEKCDKQLNQMKSAGFISFDKKSQETRIRGKKTGNVVYEIKPKPKMQSFILGKNPIGEYDIEVGTIEFKEITRIEEVSKKQRKVYYTVIRNYNDVGKYLTELTGKEPTESERSVFFYKSEDGWSME